MVAQVDNKYISTRPWKLWSRLISYVFFEGRPLTTRGQWINPFLLSAFSLAKRFSLYNEVKEPVFILGSGRSGTTILGVVLSMHRDVGFLNEPKLMWHAICPKEDLIGSYTRKEAFYRLDEGDATPEACRIARNLFGLYLSATLSRRVVDKYPELIFRVPFVKKIFPDAKFIFLVRNGWDTCHSIDRWSGMLGGQVGNEVHDWWGANRRKWNLLLDQIIPEHGDLYAHVEKMKGWKNQSNMAAVEWIVTMREGLKLKSIYPDSVLQVNYETLCNSTESEIYNIANFLNLRKDDKFVEYALSVLKAPERRKNYFAIEKSIETAFLETMDRLGYGGLNSDGIHLTVGQA